jgi:hypothetical protein
MTKSSTWGLIFLALLSLEACDGCSDETSSPTTTTSHGGAAGHGGGTAGHGGGTAGHGAGTAGHGGGTAGNGGTATGGCGQPDNCLGHCDNDTQDCGETGIDCGGECGLCQQTPILTDDLSSSGACSSGCSRALTGSGEWTGGGWIPRAWGDRIVYDFGGAVSCGYAKIVVDNFSPLEQVTPKDVEAVYVLFAGVHDEQEVDHCQSLSQLNLLSGPCYGCPDPQQAHHLKLIGGLVGAPNPSDCTKSCDWFDLYSPDTWEWAAPSTFTFEFRWNLHRYSGWVNQVPEFDYQPLPTYPGECSGVPSNCWPTPKLPELRYLYVGQTPSCTASLTAGADGPIFTQVEAVATVCTESW